MKKVFLYIGVLLLFGLTSCDEYLDVKDKGEVLPETAEEFAALIHKYLLQIDDGSDYTILGDYTKTVSYEGYSDNLDGDLNSTTRVPIYVGTDINSLTFRYKTLYEIIKDCNIILNDLEDKSSELGKKVIATAYALRGICYYNLMRCFCEPYDKTKATDMNGVPLVEVFDMEGSPDRSTLKETADFIVDDLKTAIGMNQTDKNYRIYSDVMKFYLARVYFWIQEWDLATSTAKEVLDLYPLIQGEEYKAMMKSEVDQKGNELLRSGINKFQSYTDLQFGYLQGRLVAQNLIDLYTEKENDVRYELYFTDKLLNNKVLRSVIRSAEMCLIMAESYVHAGNTTEALRYLNHLRSHRISPYTDYTEQTLPEVDPEALIKVDATGKALTPLMSAILNERRKEFYMENGDRWFELKRNGCPEFWWGYSGVKYVTQKFLYTFPLPKADIKLNSGLVQNPGYDNY
ncbi:MULTISPECIES: RagB/SusD family nutrient uptake outer membrane protein [Butyricimonas]|uniref:RagB/SusD family nutrient uptake outer membrane protein n=1 Tax=Butyricimonas TaxID=574697 RepID=UPI0007FB403C|nr:MULTISPECIES: RagB/SusD family nutrient uptake outer membrane protein [Butyricimonas]